MCGIQIYSQNCASSFYVAHSTSIEYSPGKQKISNKPSSKHLLTLFPIISYAKIKQVIFFGPQINKILNDDYFS